MVDDKGNKFYFGKNSNIFKDQYESFAGLKLICEGPAKIIYVVSDNNNFGCINYNWSKAIGLPPFNFPALTGQEKSITKIWIDVEGVLFIATNTDTIYSIADATKLLRSNSGDKRIST